MSRCAVEKKDARRLTCNTSSSLNGHTDIATTNVDLVTTATDNASQDTIDAIDCLPFSQASTSPSSGTVPTTDDCYNNKEDLQQTIDCQVIKDHYPLRRDLILKRRRLAAEIWDLLGLPSCGYVYRDGDVQDELLIVET
ncbi:hypothetical protein BDQ17DRAFT_1429871 [Cyathus striatus]|nr:hypothetical protein BDQ17DRAFT_1429871 [Cyathus striatus]